MDSQIDHFKIIYLIALTSCAGLVIPAFSNTERTLCMAELPVLVLSLLQSLTVTFKSDIHRVSAVF